MDIEILRCPRCAGSLSLLDSGYRCEKCDSNYANTHGVPILIPGIAAEPSSFTISEELVGAVLNQERISDEAANREVLRSIFSTNYRMQDMFLTAENNFYLQRIGLKVDGYRSQAASSELTTNGRVKFKMPFDMIPATLPPQEMRSWNVRLENMGERTFLCQGKDAFFVTYRLTDQNGQVLADSTIRTALPVDIPGGRGITLPVWISPPEALGRYVVEIRLDQDGRDWEMAPGITKEIEVKHDWGSAVPAQWLTIHRLPETYNYQIDHEIGRVFLKEELARMGRPLDKVFEIGGCCNPMTWDLPCEVVSADIDVQTLQIGALHFSSFKPNVKFLAADAHNLPFADGVFDCAVMFATLHHFLDPAACLKELARIVKDDGFVAILCEPIGSYFAESLSAEFKADLDQGINEQIFTAEEYGQIFTKAGLDSPRAVIDGGSFKAILRKKTPVPTQALEQPAESESTVVAPQATIQERRHLLSKLKSLFSA